MRWTAQTLLLVAMWFVPALGQQSFKDDRASAGSANTGSAVETEPHPWLATAPGEFVRLIERGKVRLVIDDRKLQENKRSALTLFRFSVQYDFRYNIQWLNPSTRESAGWKAKLTAWVEHPRLDTEHTVVLSSRFQPADPWKSKLMKHEFDHVAISTDPRWKNLISRVLKKRQSWTKTWEQADRPDEKEIEAEVRERISAITNEFERLVQAQYVLLDKVSQDGQANLDDRMKFFKELYSVETLKECNFLYLDAARVMMQDSSDRDVTEHYLFLDNS